MINNIAYNIEDNFTIPMSLNNNQSIVNEIAVFIKKRKTTFPSKSNELNSGNPLVE